MDMEDIKEFLFASCLYLGLAGAAVLYFTIIAAIFLFLFKVWSIKDYSFKIILSIGLWLSTFLLAHAAKVGQIKIGTENIKKDIKLMQEAGRNYRENRILQYFLINTKRYSIKFFYIFLFMIIPIMCFIIGKISKVLFGGP